MDMYAKDSSTSLIYNSVNSQSRNPWRASPFRRIPWLGLSAFLGALLGVGVAVSVLVVSNGQPASHWSIQPTVYLAIASAVTNILLHFALAEAVNIAWWRRATQDDAKIADLHRTWSYGNSLWAAIKSGRHINTVAVACMLVAIGPVNGPLFQRASRITVGRFAQDVNMEVLIAPELPDGYSGYLSGREQSPALLTSAFTVVVNDANTQAPTNVSSSGCTGKCETSVRGAGFAINCSTSTIPYTLTPTSSPNTDFNPNQEAVMNGTQAFGSYFLWGWEAPGTIDLGVQFKSTEAADGDLSIRNCTMQAAVVDYPVIINGNKSTIELAPNSTMFDDTVHNLTTVVMNSMTGPTTLGGLYKALSSTYDSTANLRFVGAVGYELITTGATANRYAVLGNTDTQPYANYTLSFSDPVNDLVQSVRDLMFRAAVAATANSTSQYVTAKQTSNQPIYQSNYMYMVLAAVCTALGWLATLPVFIGWWHVGRKVSLSPIETAKAFKAPMLRNTDSNADADALLKEVGNRKIRYGAVTVYGSELDGLEMNEPQLVRTPDSNQRFIG